MLICPQYICWLSISCLLALNSYFITCSGKMDMGPLNNFPLPDGMVLSFANRGHWRDTTRGKDFASWFWDACLPGSYIVHYSPSTQLCSMLGSPVPSFCSVGRFTSTRFLHDHPFSSVHLLPCIAVRSFPRPSLQGRIPTSTSGHSGLTGTGYTLYLKQLKMIKYITQ